MIPFALHEQHKDFLDAQEQEAIEKERWIDDEAQRLLACFPDYLHQFRHWNLHPEVKKCCAHPEADETYIGFITNLAYLQATRNYDLQVALGWEAPS
ncbi:MULTISPECIES: host nuclease inhibitor GamL [unclassified Pantoea]|uniref:host nuclease inhibitor GamL n=1 Tax=unclassified Pantoea TaxID=2630326 RepID=UPI0028A7F3AF|nr:host nuclease inhibitor GamL [Pantoea sp.]